MWRYIAAISFFMLTTHFPAISGWRSFTINLINASSTVYTDKYNLNVSVSKNALNLNVRVNEQVQHPLARMEIYFQSADGGHYNVEVMNRTVDVCKLFSNKLYEPLIQIIFGIIKQHGLFPDGCPISAKTYNLKNVIFDAEHFPPYMPERGGYAQLYFSRKEDDSIILDFRTIIFFETKSKAAQRFKPSSSG